MDRVRGFRFLNPETLNHPLTSLEPRLLKQVRGRSQKLVAGQRGPYHRVSAMASGLGLKAQGFGFRLVELLGFRGVDGFTSCSHVSKQAL